VFFVICGTGTAPVPFAVFLAVALFELLVNVTLYGEPREPGRRRPRRATDVMKIFFAVHGMLSLLALPRCS
jgi:hypothetical protein